MASDKPMALNDRETATLLHGLRMIQEIRHPGRSTPCLNTEDIYTETKEPCEHLDGLDPLKDEEIDALCERLNFYDVAVMPPIQGQCIPTEELQADIAALSPEDRAILDALPQGPKEDEEPAVLPCDPDGQNDDRANWAESAIQAFIDATRTDREDALSDLLCDLMHWADRNQTDFAHQLDRARFHYDAETGGEMVSCRLCGKHVAYRSAVVIDHGTGPEKGNGLYYCSIVCKNAH